MASETDHDAMRSEAAEGTPGRLQQAIVERLTGATGDPDHVVAAARSCAERALPLMLETLNDQFASPVEIEVKSIEATRLGESVPSEESHEAITIARASGSSDALTLQIEPAAISIALNAYLGGEPEQAPAVIDRALTSVELEIATLVFEAFAKALNGRGQRSFDIRFPLPDPVSGGDLKRLNVRDGPAVRMVFAISTPGGEGVFRALMPQRFLLENRSEVSANTENAPAEKAAWRARFNGEVMRSVVTLEATVPMARMTLGQLACLKTGQTIELPETAQSETRLHARGRKLFVCEFGKLGQNYTVRIKQPFDAGRDFIEGLMS